MTYFLLEVGYKKIYQKTIQEQLKILEKYESPYRIQNKWKAALEKVIGIISLSTITHILNNNLLSYISKNEGQFLQFGPWIKNAQNANYILTVLASFTIPFSGENKPILFIPSRTEKIKPEEIELTIRNSLLHKNQIITFSLKQEEYNAILHNIAQIYKGKLVHTYKDSESNFCLYSFDATKESIDNDIKRFLFSLPPNVYLRSIYKIPSSSSINTNINSEKEKNIKKYIKTHHKFFRYFNRNETFVSLPFSFLEKILPENWRPPRWSPIKNTIQSHPSKKN